MENYSKKLCVALDLPTLNEAVALAQKLGGIAGYLKVGLELFVGEGPRVIEKIAGFESEIFLDLKLHDIPNTVAGAVASASRLGASLLTIHASGGPEMIAAARKSAEENSGDERVKLLAVTVLTSLEESALKRTFGIDAPPEKLVERLAKMAKDSGAHGAVCSPREAALVRQACGQDFLVVTPGIRPAGAAIGDQKRVTTPEDAIKAGADIIVVGRPVSKVPDPRTAAREILASIEKAVK